VFALRAWDREALLEIVLRDAGRPLLASPDASPACAAASERTAIRLETVPGESTVVLGLADSFEAGTFKSADVVMKLPANWFPHAGERLVKFLRESYVPCNIQRADRKCTLVLPKKALKRRSVLMGEYEQDAQWTRLSLTVGPKFDLGEYLRSFGARGVHRRAQVAFSRVVW
jgi:hypothetical protein